MKSKEFLVELNRRGLVPGPDETEATFFARCDRAIPLTEPPLSPLSQQLFGTLPDWIEVQYQTKGLRFWEAACTWIEGNSIRLQLHPTLLEKKKYWGYRKEEIIAHEFVHAVRGQFDEPIFEEILAYRTSSSPFRRYWGPLLRTAKESLYAVLALLTCTIAFFFDPLGLTLWCAAVGLLGLAIYRLVKAQRTFKRALHHISQLVGLANALAVMLRLTDKEIICFSKMDPEKISAYMIKMAKTHIRWQQIRAAYFESSRF